MLVNFIVSRSRVADMQFFVTSQPVPEQSQIPTGIISTVLYPLIEKNEPAVDEIAVRLRLFQFLLNFRRQFRRDVLVRIQNQHPFIFPRHILQCPVFLFGKFAVPRKLHHRRAALLGEFNGAIRGTGIHHYNFIRPADGLNTSRDV